MLPLSRRSFKYSHHRSSEGTFTLPRRKIRFEAMDQDLRSNYSPEMTNASVDVLSARDSVANEQYDMTAQLPAGPGC